MAEVVERLTAALADRYRIERELGAGGMATVYLAHDLRQGRQVALKVLRPELAVSLGAERFLREIQIAARLNHPHILALHESGEADGVLWYTMPYVEGESLRDRLRREEQLPIEDALRITSEVADGLEYAHGLGVVHRDIKPENILLSAGHALIADFGVARAVTTSGGQKLTETGMAVGTPTYMSPEQASGSGKVDARSDLYSLGCVLYEMLAGEPPYTGASAPALIAKKLSEPTPRVSITRETVPPPVEEALAKALSKAPADRFATAAQFAAALRVDVKSFERSRRVRRRLRQVAFAVIGILGIVAAVVGVNRYGAASRWKRLPLEPNAVAVLPFRVAAIDPGIQLLDQGLPDMLFGLLGGDNGPRVANIDRMLRKLEEMKARQEWGKEDAPLRLAADLGAGLVMTGSLVQSGAMLTVNAVLQRVPDGQEVARHTIVVPTDSVGVLPVRLVLGLIAEQLGEDRERLELFTRHDLEAVMAYLAGMRSLRAGHTQQAIDHFKRAEQRDSTFALPLLAMGLNMLGDWADYGRHLRRSWALRAQLNDRDLAALTYARVNSAIDTAESGVANLAAASRWAALASDDPDAVATHATQLYFAGAIANVPEWHRQFRELRERAWRLDSLTAGRVLNSALWHALWPGDPEWARRVLPSIVARVDTTAEMWTGVRWGIAQVLGDSATAQAFRAQVMAGTLRLSPSSANSFSVPSLLGFSPMDDALLLHDRGDDFLRRVGPVLLRPVGRIAAAEGGPKTLEGLDGIDPGQEGPTAWIEAVYAFPEMERSAPAAEAACRAWVPLMRPLLPGLDEEACRRRPSAMHAAWLRAAAQRNPVPKDAIRQACFAALYRARAGDTVGVRDLARRLMPRFREHHMAGLCPAMVEAFVESHETTRRDTPALDAFESLMRTGPGMEFPMSTGMLVVTRLARQRGQLQRALEAAGDGCCWGMAASVHARAPLLREEGELALALGDTARAIGAFRKYLNIRVAPDPGVVQAQVDSVRMALAALEKGRPGRN